MLLRVWQKTVEEERIRVFVFQQLEDNYSYIIETRSQAIIIDPAESSELIQAIVDASLELKAILCTHYHQDHIQGVKGLLERFSCQVVGPQDGVDFVNCIVSHQEEIIIGPFAITVLSTPGHTLNHLCYFLADFKILFSGDMVFPCGCGKVVEGTFQQMLESIKLIKSLPKDTAIFSGHEYSLQNMGFALSLEPMRNDIKERMQNIDHKDQFPVPTTLEQELEMNPFFRTDQVEFRKALNLASASELETLIRIRELKDQFQS
jgi:hydroxyacylglutathione hydrolase